ncbi:MAG: FAD:protein FMN transferase [Erysipelotrichaceae bacterium]|nr:FAD:protein FMN transferase [Erysipelotrichaceae bacterium]
MKRIILVILSLLLVACSATKEENEAIKKESVFLGTLNDSEGQMVLPLNTEVYLTYCKESKKDVLLNKCQELLFEYHKLLDSYRYYIDEDNKTITNLKVINQHFNEEIVIDEKLFDALKEAIELSKLTKGYFNPTIGKLFALYNDKFLPYDTNNTDPSKEEIKLMLEAVVPYEEIDKYIVLNEKNTSITLIPYNNLEYEINLGAFSKGYVIDKIYEELIKYHTSFMINAGSSSICAYIDENEDVKWSVGSKDPNDKSSILYAYQLNNGFISTSGDYEQYYFNENNIRRHHIINPFTGYSENYHRVVEIKSDKKDSAIDALTTALFSIDDLQTIQSIIDDVSLYYDMKIDYCLEKDDYTLIMSEGFKEILIDSYSSNKIKEIIIE